MKRILIGSALTVLFLVVTVHALGLIVFPRRMIDRKDGPGISSHNLWGLTPDQAAPLLRCGGLSMLCGLTSFGLKVAEKQYQWNTGGASAVTYGLFLLLGVATGGIYCYVVWRAEHPK